MQASRSSTHASNIVLENNLLQKKGETHYTLAHDLVFVGADRFGR